MMTDRNAVPKGLFEELHALTAASLSGEITPEQRERLEALLEDPVAVDLYLDVMHETSTLLTWADYPGLIAGDTMSADGPPWKRPADRPRTPGFRPRLRRLWLAAALSLASVLVVVLVWKTDLGRWLLQANKRNEVTRSDEPGSPAPSTAHAPHPTSVDPRPTPPASTPVARLVRTYDCVWSDTDKSLADGDRLESGKHIELRSGLIEIVFDCGARMILQGPASLVPESARSASLSSGKVTVHAESAAAKGFAIRTPAMKTIDLGTEFGLEVSPARIEQVHVFRGQVEVAAASKDGPSAPPQRLTEKEGIEVNLNTKGVKLVANNGERFARSLDEAQNKRHVVAYWRFEDHPVGVLVPESQQGRAPRRGSLDSSINGNDLYSWDPRTQPRFSGDVPARSVPQSGESNVASLDNTNPPVGGAPTRDLYTMSPWSRPSPVDLQAITPSRWTIEASVKLARLRGVHQAFVTRDGANVSDRDPKLPPLAFHVTPQKHLEILFCDIDRRVHEATAEALTVEGNHWYHAAAVSDGKNLKLYVDSLDGKGYLLWAVTPLPTTGSTALARGVWSENPKPRAGDPYIWSVGRGYYDGEVSGWFQGWIDEVRICDVALAPEDFLFADRPEKSNR